MAFPSPHLYLDPSNWHQQNHPQRDEINTQLPLPLPPLPSTTTIRPGSMADRARLANIPQPEAALKCPRCDSINTKFCYFNNYSLNQPRHFCKTCRRYWTRGGTLRNVPVGGGCRRNKRSKKPGSKASSGDTNTAAPMTTTSGNTLTQEQAALGNAPTLPPLPYPFMSGMQDHPLGIYSNIGGASIGLNYSASRFAGDGGAVEQWRTVAAPTNQQFPFISGLDQTSSVKIEGSTTQALINPTANYGSSVVGQDHQYSNWGANMWNDHQFSHGFATPSTDQIL